jgi:hypothetical protein
VVATDVDSTALELVAKAAEEQGLTNLETATFDLVRGSLEEELPEANLYLLSDVFESADVAVGAARVCKHVLRRREDASSKVRVWVFAQADRAQREVYLQEMQKQLQDPSLSWHSIDYYEDRQAVGIFDSMWLCDVDETTVSYG